MVQEQTILLRERDQLVDDLKKQLACAKESASSSGVNQPSECAKAQWVTGAACAKKAGRLGSCRGLVDPNTLLPPRQPVLEPHRRKVLCEKILANKAEDLDGFQMMINCYAGLDA